MCNVGMVCIVCAACYVCAVHVVFFLDLHLSVIFQLQLLTTWGDPYYIGLNGLEFYDQNHEKISLSDNSILSSCVFTSLNSLHQLECISI